MARLKFPQYPSRPHGSGQARITIGGESKYLGKWNSEESFAAYARELAKFSARGGGAPLRKGLSVAEACDAYEAAVAAEGMSRPVRQRVGTVLKRVRRLYGRERADACEPEWLKVVRQSWVGDGVGLVTVNQYAGIVVRLWQWLVEESLVEPAVHWGLKAVRRLKPGRTTAPVYEPVGPAPVADVEACLPFLPPALAAVVRLQLVTGMRPGEACNLRPADLDRSGEVWVYRYEEHKTRHHGKERHILIGPKGRAILGPYLADSRSPDDPVFPIGLHRRRRPAVLKPYEKSAYRNLVLRACAKAGTPAWTPNQLRHTFATLVRQRADIDAARILLGHSDASTTLVYAERSERERAKAAGVIAEVG